MSRLSAFRVGVVGARRVRQGTGPFLARFFHAAGTRVVAVAGTSRDSARAAAEGLRAAGLAEPAAHDDVGEMLASERLDALVIASPRERHLAPLEAALAAGVHVLCEKPLVLHGGDFAHDAERLAGAFAAANLCLAVAAPWRFALPAYLRLFPDVTPRTARRFEMRLSPASADAATATLAESMPHPLALLEHVFPSAVGGEPRDVRVEARRGGGLEGGLDVAFAHPGPRGAVDVAVRLVPCAEPPRPAAFGFDGALAHRRVALPSYAFTLRDGEGDRAREVALPDPLEALVRDFVARVRRGPPFPVDPGVAAGARALARILAAAGAAALPAPRAPDSLPS